MGAPEAGAADEVAGAAAGGAAAGGAAVVPKKKGRSRGKNNMAEAAGVSPLEVEMTRPPRPEDWKLRMAMQQREHWKRQGGKPR